MAARLGQTIRRLRLARHLSLRSLARHIGVSAGYLSQVEHGRCSVPTVARLRAIALILETDPEPWLAIKRERDA